MTRKEIDLELKKIAARISTIELSALSESRDFTESESAEIGTLCDRSNTLMAEAGLPASRRLTDPQEPEPQNHFRRHSASAWAVLPDGETIKAFLPNEKLADQHYAPQRGEAEFSIGGWVRAGMGISSPRGQVLERELGTGALVPIGIVNRIIDLIRARSVVVKSGATTIPIPGPMDICRIISDCTVYTHSEGATDVSESVPVFDSVRLDPPSLGALVPLSMELAEDSGNLDRVLEVAIGGAFSSKLDENCIDILRLDAGITDGSADPALWDGILTAVSAMLSLNMDLPPALIGSPADFVSRATEKASTGGAWLGRPSILMDVNELETTSFSTGQAVLGNFETGFCLACRRDLKLELIRFQKPTALSHVLVCTMRIGGVVLQPGALYRLGGCESS
jgi:HK97 family phage major capsid protein